ncbi:MAG: TraR/DksA family transcriptional regulator [Syntrophobacteraceae bacterium]|jgi:DnaK suppressor protein
MSKEEILFLKNVLLDRRSSILERVQMLAAAWLELEERAIELEEEAQKASIAKPYDKLEGNGKNEIEQIDLALAKMPLGDYGVCESCGDDIAPRRLQAIPWARLCVDCARDFEKQHKSLPQTTETVVSGKIPDEYQGLTNEQTVHLVYERLQTDERIETEELRISFRKGVIFLDGAVESETEHELILQILTDSMGFSAIVDRIGINDLIMERDEFTGGSPGVDGLDSRLFYDRDALREDAFETKGQSPYKYFNDDLLS